MLETIAVILLILWLLGMVSSYTMGGFVHILLVIALVVIVGLLWSSTTGSLRPEPKTHPRPPPGARDAIPRPIAP